MLVGVLASGRPEGGGGWSGCGFVCTRELLPALVALLCCLWVAQYVARACTRMPSVHGPGTACLACLCRPGPRTRRAARSDVCLVRLMPWSICW